MSLRRLFESDYLRGGITKKTAAIVFYQEIEVHGGRPVAPGVYQGMGKTSVTGGGCW